MCFFQWHEFLLFAGLMLVDMAVLAVLAVRYKYVDYTDAEKSDKRAMAEKEVRRNSLTIEALQ